MPDGTANGALTEAVYAIGLSACRSHLLLGKTTAAPIRLSQTEV